MNYYPEHLKELAAIAEALNTIPFEGQCPMHLKEVPVYQEELLVGHMRDEIGGSYSFFPIQETAK